jgi:hypothetical protein
MVKKLIYKDKSGNKLYEDIEKTLIVFNSKGKLVNPREIKPFIKQPNVKKAINNFYKNDKNKGVNFCL